MTVRTLARTIGIAAVVWCAALFPQEAAAQCAVSWSDTAASGSQVSTEALVEDYYDMSGCGGSYGFFEHGYLISIQMTCGTQYQEVEDGTSQAYGGGSLYTYANVTAIESTVCDINISMVILCSGIFYQPIYEAYEFQQPAVCLDQRTNIIAEYNQYNVNLTPTCPDFTQTRASPQYFTFAEINTGDYSWALVRGPLIAAASAGYGLDKWRTEYGSARSINSAYRNPSRNATVGGAGQSRHMYGDAADLDVVSNASPEWTDLRDAANRSNPDFVEPSNGPCGLGCVHADWRNHAGGYQ